MADMNRRAEGAFGPHEGRDADGIDVGGRYASCWNEQPGSRQSTVELAQGLTHRVKVGVGVDLQRDLDWVAPSEALSDEQAEAYQDALRPIAGERVALAGLARREAAEEEALFALDRAVAEAEVRPL